MCYNGYMTVVMRLKKRFYFVAARYFRFFANFAFKRWSPRVIAVTGSAGKTTMLHMVEFELGDKAHYSHDANSAFGIAFDLLGMDGVRVKITLDQANSSGARARFILSSQWGILCC